MPIPRAKTAESLYNEVADYDLVIVPDGAFARTLNRRLDRPQFGHFAITPRRLAAGRREEAEDRLAFLEVIDQTDHNWNAVAYAIGNVLQCWEQQGSIDAILDYDAYIDETTREVVDIMRTLRTTSNRLSEYTIDDQSVVVAGYDQLTTLERSILPAEFDRVDLYTEETFHHPDFHIFQSATDIVTALLETITAENAANVAIVLDSGSKYSSLVESGLEAADIPFYGGPGFIDDPHHRAFVRLLRIAFRGTETTVGQVQPLLTQMDIDVPIADHEKRLEGVESPAIEWVHEFCVSIQTRTFSEALGRYVSQTGHELPRFAEELQNLGLADELVTETGVDRLGYYLETYEVPVDRENEGVLLVDAKSSAYVDRSTVFHLGMGQDWTHSAPHRPWVDTDRQFDRYIGNFQRLIQSGATQYYLVQDTEGGDPVTPCLYLDDLLDEEFERFSDLRSSAHRFHTDSPGDGFERNPIGIEPETVDTISQSTLNSYVNSPRDYFFSYLVDSADKERFVKGTLFHDFAEFYVEHPDVIASTDLEELVEVMLDEVRPFFSRAREPLRRRTYRIGIETIMTYLDEHGPESEDFLTPASGWGENFFAEYFDEVLDSPLTERWFEDSSLGIKGMIDLVNAPDHLLDYKSGTKKRTSQVVKRAMIDPPADTPNFQVALYLTYYRQTHPDEPLEFTFFHFLEPMDDVIRGDADIEEALTTVSYYPFTFDEYVGSRDAHDVLCDGYNDCEETFEDLGYAAYGDIMAQLKFPDTTDKDEVEASEFAGEFTSAVVDRTSEDVADATKGAEQAIREFVAVRNRTLFREDLDAFESFVDERLRELNSRRGGEERFPVDGLTGEPNYRRVDHRDLLLEGER